MQEFTGKEKLSFGGTFTGTMPIHSDTFKKNHLSSKLIKGTDLLMMTFKSYHSGFS